ncbi:MAG TPA: CBS domain-containing protein [Acidimicrobiales bacterium]|nr:CBS domain-containing protein [Acidimicrobiales bacterium]
MRISDLLKEKGSAVATIRGSAIVADAVTDLGRHQIGALVVSADGEHIDGIVSERDVVRGLGTRHETLLGAPVTSIMSATVHTCSPDDDTDSLMAVMTERRIRHVPVVREGVLCGIVSIGDVVKCRIGELERNRKELVDYINGR